MNRWKALLFTPMLIGALALFAVSAFTPARYRSSATILVVPQQVPTLFVPRTSDASLVDRLGAIEQQILSRTELEHLIDENHLYPEERAKSIIEEVVERMRRDIDVEIAKASDDNGHADSFKVSYVADSPRVAMKVAEELASLFIAESLKDREMLTKGTSLFLEGQLEDLRRRLIDLKTKKEGLTQEAAAIQAIDIDAVTAEYRDVFRKKEEANLAANLERRQIGEQFRLLDPARIPEKPIGPTRLARTIGGALIGFGAGLVLLLVVAIRRSQP